MTDQGPVLAARRWRDNGYLVADLARLGYLRSEWLILDPTYGSGTFWHRWQPRPPGRLVACDLVPSRSPLGSSVDLRHLPFRSCSFHAVSLDGPYKLNGDPDPEVDARYGVDVPATWQERHQLIRDGMTEAVRVLRPGRRVADGGVLLVKCMDQVAWHHVRWQTDEFTRHAEDLGLVKIDRFDLLGHARKQPEGRKQRHAHGRPSTMLVFHRAA